MSGSFQRLGQLFDARIPFPRSRDAMKATVPLYITYAVASTRYGIGRTRLQGLVHRGVIIAYRPGKRVLLEVASLEAWFATTQISARHQRGGRRKYKPFGASDGK